MPSAVQGFGTTYYGECDYATDGSYVTTEWIIAALLPVLPIRSARVKDAGYESEITGFMRSTQHYQLLEETRPHFLQVLRIYAFTLMFLGWGYGIFLLTAKVYSGDIGGLGGLVLAAACSLPFCIPVVLRRRARRKPIPSTHLQRIEQAHRAAIAAAVPGPQPGRILFR